MPGVPELDEEVALLGVSTLLLICFAWAVESFEGFGATH